MEVFRSQTHTWNCFYPLRTQPYPSLNMLKLSYLTDLLRTSLERRSETVKQNQFNYCQKKSWKVRIRHVWTKRVTCHCFHVIKIFHPRYVTSVWARISAMRRSAACCSRATYTGTVHSQFGRRPAERYQQWNLEEITDITQRYFNASMYIYMECVHNRLNLHIHGQTNLTDR